MSEGKRSILLVEDDELFRRSMVKHLEESYRVLTAGTAGEALEVLGRTPPDLALLDLILPEVDGLELLRRLRRSWSDLPVLMLSAVDRVPSVVEAIKLGAFDYLTKPVDVDELLLAIDRALEASDIRSELEQRRELQRLAHERYRLVGESPALERIRREIATAARGDASVLLEGETGTGKELVARGIHAASPRASGPFVAINCGAIARELIESEFFGHRKGAFSGAHASVKGKFELAHRGTLLLDEVGELPLPAQVKLLRVLEEREFYPVGGSELRRVDVRVIAATNRDLRRMVETGELRQDLFFRLNVYKILIPPLRERRQDIPPLAEHFLEVFGARLGKHFEGFDEEARQTLLEQPWKGNVRELKNLVERVALAEEGGLIRRRHLRFLEPPATPAKGLFRLPDGGVDLEALERDLMRQALERARWNQTRAARLLGLSPPTFRYRMEKYDLK